MKEINQEEVKLLYKKRDRAIRALSEDGKFRVVALNNTATAKTAQERHNLPYLAAFLLARTLSAASIISAFLKGEERTIVEAEGNGPISRVFAEAMNIGEVKGFVVLAKDAGTRKVNDLSEAIGLGLLKVTRITYDQSEPTQGIVPLQNGDIASDLAYFYSQSEQIPSAVILDVDFDENGKILYSGGLMIQSMPGATDEDNKMVYDKLMEIQSLTKYFKEDKTPLEMMKEVLPFDFKVIKSSQLDFYCRCSKDNFLGKLKTIGIDEIKDMKKSNDNELVCNYCNEKYEITLDDFETLIAELQADKN